MAKRRKKKSRSRKSVSIKRVANTREQLGTDEKMPLMLFSFKDFQYNSQIPPGQTYEDWQEEKLLAYMLTKFGYICNVNRIEAEQQKFIKVYGDFPSNSEFTNPFPDVESLQWAVIMNIKGQKPRVAGHVIGHVFYVVFLDMEHQFYPSSR